MSDRFGACSLALILALLMAISASAAAVPTLMTTHGAACSVDRNRDPHSGFDSDGIIDVVNPLAFVQDCWPQ